jgi:hypothetical protein
MSERSRESQTKSNKKKTDLLDFVENTKTVRGQRARKSLIFVEVKNECKKQKHE